MTLIKYLTKLLFLSQVLFAFISKGQVNPDFKRSYHWYFGNNAGLDFNTGSPIVDLNSQMHQHETGSVMSDSLGNLLFYTDGDTVWNKNHQIMPNGTGLINCESASQGGLILKKPHSNSMYYIFTNDCQENNGVSGIHYSLIDMSLNGGLGDVSIKNTLLFAPSTEKISAVYHCNNKDIWIVSQIRNSNSFCAYLLDNNGVSTTPVITNIGSVHNDEGFSSYSGGLLKFSPDGTKLAVTYVFYPNSKVELFDFNSNTGNISNFISLPSDTSSYGISFSPDNSKLYISAGGGGGVQNKILQYDLSLINPPSIIASRYPIYIMPSLMNNPILGLELAPNSKIYGARFGLDSLSAISNPNSAGASCNFVLNSISLQGRKSNETLPQFIQSYFNTGTQTICTTGINNYTTQNDISLFPVPANQTLFINSDENYIKIEAVSFLGIIIELNIVRQNSFYSIDIQLLNSGLYTLYFKTKDNTFMKKISIIH